MEHIVAAAIIDADGLINTMPAPARHHTLIHAMAKRGDKTPIGGVQGFITSSGRFVSRTEAAQIAVAAGQLDHSRPELFSEDLW